MSVNKGSYAHQRKKNKTKLKKKKVLEDDKIEKELDIDKE